VNESRVVSGDGGSTCNSKNHFVTHLLIWHCLWDSAAAKSCTTHAI